MHRSTPIVLLPLLLTSCAYVQTRDSVRVDGVRLEERHTETIEVSAWGEGLTVDATQGDVRIEPTEGTSTITLTVYERIPGDARAIFEDGALTTRTRSGDPSAVGTVVVRVNGPLPSLRLTTGMGDVETRDVRVSGPVVLLTGMGDVILTGLGEPQGIEVESGMGDVRIHGAACGELVVTTGLGDVDVDRVVAARAALESGMGDLEISDSRIERLDADTGLGDIEVPRSSYQAGELNTGLGDVRTD